MATYIQHILGYPNLVYICERKTLQTTSTFTKITWVVVIAKSYKMAPSNRQSNAECQKGIDFQKEAGYLQAHSYRYILHCHLECYGL